MKAYFFVLPILLIGCSKVSFTDSFKEQNKGKSKIEIPEVQELVHIAIAITHTGLDDSNMVNHTTGYYQEVLDHFKPFKNESLIKELDKNLPSKYAHVKMDACGYYFDSTNHIVKNENYNQLNWSSKNYIDPLLDQLQEFSDKSNFREFYSAHKGYYAEQITLLEKQSPVQKQWDWLEQKFPQRYDNYWITFSPLVGGSHSTNRFITDDFKQTVMFVQGGINSKEYSDKVIEGLMTRVVFTEIDHNYVNPTSDRFANEIKDIFKNREHWTTIDSWADSYKSELSVFNEYMTWAVFSLYASENFNAQDFETINHLVENQMDNYRGFNEFSRFNRKLLSLYKEQNPRQIEELYPLILDWCKIKIANKR